MPIIESILDLDIYKIYMMNFVLQLYPDTIVTYKFKNRGKQRFNKEFIIKLQKEINSLANLKLTDKEYIYLKENHSYLSPGYIEYLKNFRLNPSNVKIKLTEDNNLDLEIEGLWRDTILFETILMSIISELYFEIIDKDWSYEEQRERARAKIRKLSDNYCNFVEMGSRRRRSWKTQNIIISEFVNYSDESCHSSFLGSSNVYFSMKYGIKCWGSIAHEIFQAEQVLSSYNRCNYFALTNWLKVFPDAKTALTDTITVDMFLKDFDKTLSTLYQSTRHDSGDEFVFTDKMINHYNYMKINPKEKMIVFSDGLDVDKAIEIKKYCEGKIKCSFGIGTHFSGNFLNSPQLNMVIKLWNVNNMPVVKLSDIEGKENGDIEAIKFMKWIVKNQLKK